jgi:DNA-binding NtrC family response regulator
VKVLRKRNLHCIGVDRGLKAIEILEKEPFDVVVLDFRMPGMDGIQTLKEIKRRWPLVEVIMLTAFGSVEMGIQGMQLGAFDYVMKPPDLDDLIDKIAQAYERKLLHEGMSS